MPSLRDFDFTTFGLLCDGIVLVAVFVAVMFGGRTFVAFLRRQEAQYDLTLRRTLLLDISPRSFTIMIFVAIIVLFFLGSVVTGSSIGGFVCGAVGLILPSVTIKYLAAKRLAKLEEQLVTGVQTLAAGVRAGLNLVQSMQLVARDGPKPLCEEFAHLLREYEYGVPLDEAMQNAAGRIGSADFRLLFSALHTHRQRGGDLGKTLDDIADSIREIQRLERRVETLTAHGKATARWLGAMPAVVIAILYLIVDSEGVRMLFVEPVGKLMLAAIIVLNILGFLWIRRTVDIDI